MSHVFHDHQLALILLYFTLLSAFPFKRYQVTLLHVDIRLKKALHLSSDGFN